MEMMDFVKYWRILEVVKYLERPLSMTMQHSISLGKIAGVIHPYPTQAEIIRKLGDQFNKSRVTPFVAKLLKFLLKL